MSASATPLPRVLLLRLAVSSCLLLGLTGCSEGESSPAVGGSDPSVPGATAAVTSTASPTDDTVETAAATGSPLPVRDASDVEPAAVDDASAPDLVEPLIEAGAELLGAPDEFDPTGLDTVAADTALAQARALAAEYAATGWRQVGTPVIDGVTVQEVDESSDPPRVTLDVCLDQSEVDVVDSDGVSMVDPDAPKRAINTYVLELRAGAWVVVDRTFPVDTGC